MFSCSLNIELKAGNVLLVQKNTDNNIDGNQVQFDNKLTHTELYAVFGRQNQ